MDDGPCENMAICKFVEGPEKELKRKYKPRKNDRGMDDDISLKDFQRARAVIGYRIKMGKLTDGQLAAVKATKGKPFRRLTDAQKRQIIDIAISEE